MKNVLRKIEKQLVRGPTSTKLFLFSSFIKANY